MHIDLISLSDKTQMNTLPSNQSTAAVYIKVSVECVYICPVCVCEKSRGIITAPVSAGNTIYKIATVFLQAGGNHGEEERCKNHS